MSDKVILVHESSFAGVPAFDVLVHRVVKVFEELPWEILGSLYHVECTFVKDFLKENPDFVYLGSEDFAHSHNEGVYCLFQSLVDEGFELRVVQPIASRVEVMTIDSDSFISTIDSDSFIPRVKRLIDEEV